MRTKHDEAQSTRRSRAPRAKGPKALLFFLSALDLHLLAIYLCILCWWTLREILLRIVQSIGSRVYML